MAVIILITIETYNSIRIFTNSKTFPKIDGLKRVRTISTKNLQKKLCLQNG